MTEAKKVDVLEDTPARKNFLKAVRRQRELGILPDNKLAL